MMIYPITKDHKSLLGIPMIGVTTLQEFFRSLHQRSVSFCQSSVECRSISWWLQGVGQTLWTSIWGIVSRCFNLANLGSWGYYFWLTGCDFIFGEVLTRMQGSAWNWNSCQRSAGLFQLQVTYVWILNLVCHWEYARWIRWIYIYASIYPSIFLSIYLSLSIYLYLSISITIYLYLSLSISIYLSIHPSIHLSIYLSLCLSLSIFIYLSA
jgi:hypothetical protein